MNANRFRKVLEHIDSHLGEELDLDTLSGVAAYSKYHFHRQFSALFGIGASKYVQLSRLRRASYQLAYRTGTPIGDLALDNGYETPESFARAFRKACGQSPSEFRERPQWDAWNALYERLAQIRREHMNVSSESLRVEIVTFEETRVAVLEHRGNPRGLHESIRKFIAWRKENRLHPRVSATFNILYEDPASVAPRDFRFDLCAATAAPIAPNDHGVIEKVIPGGRCARLRHTGSDDHLEEVITYLYASWLPSSGEEPRDFPLFLQRVVFFPDVPEQEAVTDIFLPLQ